MDFLKFQTWFAWGLVAIAAAVTLTGTRPGVSPTARDLPASVRENPGSSRLVLVTYTRPPVWVGTSTGSGGGYRTGK